MLFKLNKFSLLCKEYLLTRISSKYLFVILLLLLIQNPVFPIEKRNIGILPFENLTNKNKFDWVGFGLEYLLHNKLSNVSAFYVPEQDIVQRALQESGNGSKKINGEVVYHIGKSIAINIGITGSYSTNGEMLQLNLDFINAFNGASIFSKQYSNNIKELFTIADDIAKNLLHLAAVNLSGKENNIVYRQMTNSVAAFENFCLGYLENEKNNRQSEVIVSLFRKAISDDPKFWEAYYNLGIAYFNESDYNNALQQFDIIITSLPNFEKPYYGRGLIFLHKNDFKKAKQDFLRVTEFNPNDYKPFYYLGKISVLLKDYANANKYLKKAAELNPDYSNTYFEMGNIYFNQEKYRLSIPHYKKAAELDPNNLECHQRLGESYYRVQTYFSAYSEFQKVLEKDINNPEANFMLGITAYKQAVLSELIDAFLEMFDPEYAKEQKEKKRLQGTARERKEVYQEMVDAFTRAHKAKNNFLEATFNLALTYHDMGDLDNALIYYNKAIEMKPDLIRTHTKLAKLYEDRKDKVKALAKYKEIVHIDPSYFVAHPTLGALHNYINILDLVIEELDGKLKANPNDVQSNLTLAKIFYAQGFHGKAANLFRKILSINPNEVEAKKMLAKLERR
jgi:tetratricopeptide (TPR) repeat protein